ncbi:MAG TPA: tetratricopeptide repeat protein [Pyrinomonadaceae bacterium]|jgi:tetratricopeptide (TPR) repeat protein
MRSKKFHIKSLICSLLVFCAALSIAAQKTAVEKDPLARFGKAVEQGKSAEIERELLDYAIRNPTDAKAFELLARIRFDQGRFSEAKSLYQKALLLDPESTAAKIDLAVVNFQTGDSVAARAALDAISAPEVAGDVLGLKLARAFAKVGECQSALTAIENLSPKIKNGEALPLRARCLLETKQKIDALIPLAQGFGKQNPAIAVQFADALIYAALFKEAAGVLLPVVRAFPQNAAALVLLAKAQIYLKDYAGAKTHLAQAAKIDAQSTELTFVRALLESEQGNAAQALELLEEALRAKPDSTEILSQFVISAIRARYNGKAVRAAERLLQIKPDEPDFLYLYGAASLQNNNLPAAETALKKFFEMRPEDARGCLALGLVFASQIDRIETARAQMKKCIELNPNNFEAKYQLGLSYKTQGETGKAIEYFEATVKDAPDYALALRDLGAVYLLAGAETKARAVLEKAVALDAADADAHFQLSRAYNLLGEPALAKKHLELFQKLKNPKKDGM